MFPPGLRAYLTPRLKRTPGTNQEVWGEKSRAAFKQLADTLLEFDPAKNRYRRRVFLTTGEDPFDRFKRLLAYVAPEEDDPKKRATFNLLLAREGWTVSYLIYPNIPKRKDLELLQDAVHTARTGKKGFWKQANLLLGYEFRYAVDTAKGTAQGPKRYCADISTALLHQPSDYFRIQPENRLFIDKKDVEDARAKLNLAWA
jgi:endonuclease YncB( thermonuclease family)